MKRTRLILFALLFFVPCATSTGMLTGWQGGAFAWDTWNVLAWVAVLGLIGFLVEYRHRRRSKTYFWVGFYVLGTLIVKLYALLSVFGQGLFWGAVGMLVFLVLVIISSVFWVAVHKGDDDYGGGYFPPVSPIAPAPVPGVEKEVDRVAVFAQFLDGKV